MGARRRKKGGEYATGERDAFPHLGFPLLVSAQHKQPLKTRSVCCWAILARLLSGRLQSRRAGDGFNNRLRMNWELQLAIADLAGGDWPKLARRAAIKLTEPSGIIFPKFELESV